MQHLLLSLQLFWLQDSKQNAANKFCKLIIFDLTYLLRHVTYIFDVTSEKIVEFYDALVRESRLSHHEDPRLCRTHCSVSIRKPKWNTDSVHGHIRRVLPYIIQHLLLPAYVDSQRIRAVRVEPLLGGHGWVFVSRINSRKRGRERFLLEAESTIVEFGVSIAYMYLPMISGEHFPFTILIEHQNIDRNYLH